MSRIENDEKGIMGTFSIKGIPLKILAGVLALIAIAGGIYFSFFHSQGFVKTQATIVDVREASTDADT